MSKSRRVPRAPSIDDLPELYGMFRVARSGTIYRRTRDGWHEAKQTPNARGYLTVSRTLNGHTSNLYVHRLVATVHIPNPDPKPHINHIDGDRSNNHADNLEWCTASENARHAYRTGLIIPLRNARECACCSSPTYAADHICASCRERLDRDAQETLLMDACGLLSDTAIHRFATVTTDLERDVLRAVARHMSPARIAAVCNTSTRRVYAIIDAYVGR